MNFRYFRVCRLSFGVQDFAVQDGRIAAMEEQLKPLPYFYRGVSHWLFPSRSNTKGGFHNMRRSGRGQWVSRLQMATVVTVCHCFGCFHVFSGRSFLPWPQKSLDVFALRFSQGDGMSIP